MGNQCEALPTTCEGAFLEGQEFQLSNQEDSQQSRPLLLKLKPSKGPQISCYSTGKHGRKVDKSDLANSLSPVRNISSTAIDRAGRIQIRGHVNPDAPKLTRRLFVMERPPTPNITVRAETVAKNPFTETEPDVAWNPQPSNFRKLKNGYLTSNKCSWYVDAYQGLRRAPPTWVLDWNIQPEGDTNGSYEQGILGLIEYLPIQEFEVEGDQWKLKASFEPEVDEIDSEKDRRRRDLSEQKSFYSAQNSVASEDLFAEGKDDILYEGELLKFKPGLSANFVSRYVQISLRAFRYFRNAYEARTGKPIVAFRKKIIQRASRFKINKGSYLKRGSHIAKSGKEDNLFDNMFEVELNELYEDNFQFRNLERARIEAKEKDEFRRSLKLQLYNQSVLIGNRNGASSVSQSKNYLDDSPSRLSLSSSLRDIQNRQSYSRMLNQSASAFNGRLSTHQMSKVTLQLKRHGSLMQDEISERPGLKHRTVTPRLLARKNPSLLSQHGDHSVHITSPDKVRKTTRIISGHAMAIRDFKKTKTGKVAKLNDHAITKKEFGENDNNGRDSMQWHNREKDWYNAERRFIFAAPTKAARTKWIRQIQKGRQTSLVRENALKNKMLQGPSTANKRASSAHSNLVETTKATLLGYQDFQSPQKFSFLDIRDSTVQGVSSHRSVMHPMTAASEKMNQLIRNVPRPGKPNFASNFSKSSLAAIPSGPPSAQSSTPIKVLQKQQQRSETITDIRVPQHQQFKTAETIQSETRRKQKRKGRKMQQGEESEATTATLDLRKSSEGRTQTAKSKLRRQNLERSAGR